MPAIVNSAAPSPHRKTPAINRCLAMPNVDFDSNRILAERKRQVCHASFRVLFDARRKSDRAEHRMGFDWIGSLLTTGGSFLASPATCVADCDCFDANANSTVVV